jgi:aryl-alcohol dehydrogenase-like predicted oxidoreductase
MDYVRLGGSGLEVSRVVLGCMSSATPRGAATSGRWTSTRRDR